VGIEAIVAKISLYGVIVFLLLVSILLCNNAAKPRVKEFNRNRAKSLE
jgi:hypothetical protein